MSLDLTNPVCPVPVEMLVENRFMSMCWGGVGRSFRGTIPDYARTFALGTGYLGDWHKTNLCRRCATPPETRERALEPFGSPAYWARHRAGERCRHFEVNNARHLEGPFAAIQDPNVRVVMILKAAQTAGSLVWDLTVHWLLVHSPFMRVKVLMDSDEKARAYCTQRLMETLKANPDIAPLLPTGADRFGVTDTEMRLLNGKTLFVGGLNERNASSLPADVMIVDEGWLHQADGLMKKAYDRLKQSSTGKYIIVGQAGNVKEDQDAIWDSLDVRVPLTWCCPACGSRQPFEINKKRPEDFKPVEPSVLRLWRIAALRAQENETAPVLNPSQSGEFDFLPSWPAPVAGGFHGFKIRQKFSELNTPEEITAACAKTVIECRDCGFEIPDTPPFRRELNDSYQQEYRRTAADGSMFTPVGYRVGFWHPDPASMFVPFRETMQAYVQAIKSKDMGNLVPLRDFYLARWAKPWDPDEDKKSRQLEFVTGVYEADPSKLMPNFHSRNMGVDSQKKLDAGPTEDVVGSFWYVIRDFDAAGNSVQRARGFAESWDQLIAVQKKWGVPNGRVGIDCSKWGPQIEMVAAMNFELVTPARPNPITGRRDPFASCWRLFYGDAKAEFRVDGKPSAVSPGQETRLYKVERDKQTYVFKLFKYRWSNLAFETQLEALLSRTPGMPRYESPLGREALDPVTRAKETGILTYEQQMGARYKTLVKGKEHFEDIKNREAHYRDCELQVLVRASQDGLLGHVAPITAG